MKKTFFSVVLLLAAFTVKAQYNYPAWGAGITYSLLHPYSDTRQNNDTRGFSAALYWNYSPYVPIAFELMKGTLSGGNNETDPYHRYWNNSYTAFNLHLDIQLGELVDYDNSFVLRRLKGLYFGTGVGAIVNNLTAIRRYDLIDPTYRFPGDDHSINLLVPMRFGYEFKIYDFDDEPYLCIDFGYTHYLTFAEGLDGYADPDNHFKNNAQDMFRAITVGIKYNFGSPISYTKSIR